MKIVCFDESYVTDYIKIIEGGKMTKTTELFSEDTDNSRVNIEVGERNGTKQHI